MAAVGKTRATVPVKRRKRRSVVGTMKRRSPRRRSIGAIPASVELIAGGVAGSLATKTIVANMRPPMAMGDTDVRPFVGIMLGLGLMYVGKGNKAMEGAAVGAIAESAATMISNNWIPMFGQRTMGGFRHGAVGAPNRAGLNYGTVGAAHRRQLPMGRRRVNGNRGSYNSGNTGGAGQRFGYDGM